MSNRTIKAYRTFALADVDDGISCVELSELEGGSLRFSTSGDIDHGGAFDVPPEAVAGLVDFVAPGHRKALAVLARLVERAQDQAAANGTTIAGMANGSTLHWKCPWELAREALDVLRSAGVRP